MAIHAWCSDRRADDMFSWAHSTCKVIFSSLSFTWQAYFRDAKEWVKEERDATIASLLHFLNSPGSDGCDRSESHHCIDRHRCGHCRYRCDYCGKINRFECSYCNESWSRFVACVASVINVRDGHDGKRSHVKKFSKSDRQRIASVNTIKVERSVMQCVIRFAPSTISTVTNRTRPWSLDLILCGSIWKYTTCTKIDECVLTSPKPRCHRCRMNRCRVY